VFFLFLLSGSVYRGPSRAAVHLPLVQRRTPTTRCSIVALSLLLAASATLLPACQPAPITENDQRSQFDRYDAVRDRRAPAYLEDEYGRKRPNLRGRLLGQR